jgi:hypothetical protein
MSAIDDAKNVNKKIRKITERQLVALLALSINTAALALNYFRSVQLTGTGNAGKFWINQTEAAARQVFAQGFRDSGAIGWFIAHGIEYGQYLELSNNRKHEALRPIIRRFYSRYAKAAQAIFKG